MKYAIITGASRGLGASVARQLMEKGFSIISVARNENKDLKNSAGTEGMLYQHYHCDLSNMGETERVFADIAGKVFKDAQLVHVINNAGVIEPIEIAGQLDPSLLSVNIQVNLAAPVLISNLFLQKAKETGVKTVITNVTSGAAERPIQGWSMYCSTKAAINMFTNTAGLELENAGSISRIIAFSPGIMDTDMQATIRSSAEEAFADVETFKNYKESGSLRIPETVAEALVRLVTGSELENGKVYKVNDLL